MTRSFDSISWPGIGPDQCNSYDISYRNLPTEAKSTLYKASKWAHIFLWGTRGPKRAWCNFGKGHLADEDRSLGTQNTMRARRKFFVALEAHKAVLGVLEGTKISARFPWGPGDRTLILSTKEFCYIRDFLSKTRALRALAIVRKSGPSWTPGPGNWVRSSPPGSGPVHSKSDMLWIKSMTNEPW